MRLDQLIRDVIAWWQADRRQKALERANPRLRTLRIAEQEARRRHKPVRPIRAERQAIINQMLAGGRP